MTRCAAVLPARYGSTRLPGKPLLRDTGKYLIQHVHERVLEARRVDRVLVATDDDRILRAVREFGGEAVLTSPGHTSGTDRVAEAVADLDAEVVLNVQGDEPDIDPVLLDRLCALFDEEGTMMATAAVPVADEAEWRSPHAVKVVLDGRGRALYFSRAPVPHGAKPGSEPAPLKHIGVYAFRRPVLIDFAAAPPTELERTERLEQLRALHWGIPIRVVITDRGHRGIDTAEEYAEFVKAYRSGETH